MERIIDHVVITVKAGDGGKGCDSRLRLSVKKSIPTGGDGGAGGNVIVRADPNVTHLKEFVFHRRFAAEAGEIGGSNHKTGKRGKDLILSVPCGTVISRKEKNFLIRDLVHPGDEVLLLEGGRGGAANDEKKPAQPGTPGPTLEIVLTWKIPADVFLVGLPNAGKSTFLNRITRAHAKAETYPFSTRTPELGTLEGDDYRQILLCELPAVYRESLEGKGLGADFLKHLERGRLILLVLDPLSPFSDSLAAGYQVLRETLGRYQASLLEIPHAVVVNKMDLPEARERVEAEKFQPGVPFFLISAATGEGVDPLIRHLKELSHD